jgi:UDP-glucose 4-epimerase
LFQRFAADRPGTLLQIVRPCVIGGPGVSNYIFRAIDKPLAFRAAGKDPLVQLVHEDDCAEAMAAVFGSRLAGAFNIAGHGLMPLSAVYRRVGARVLPLPLHALLGVAGVAWRRDITSLVEAPPDFVMFVSYPWLVSNRRIEEQVGFRFRYTTEETLAAFLASRGGPVTSRPRT